MQKRIRIRKKARNIRIKLRKEKNIAELGVFRKNPAISLCCEFDAQDVCSALGNACGTFIHCGNSKMTKQLMDKVLLDIGKHLKSKLKEELKSESLYSILSRYSKDVK